MNLEKAETIESSSVHLDAQTYINFHSHNVRVDLPQDVVLSYVLEAQP